MTEQKKAIDELKKTPYYLWATQSMTPRERKLWEEKELTEGGEEAQKQFDLGQKSQAIALKLKISNWQEDAENLERVVNQTFAELEGDSDDAGIEVSFG